ncbi:hypothetical protein Tco_0064434 [Tanacetum coccineum]
MNSSKAKNLEKVFHVVYSCKEWRGLVWKLYRNDLELIGKVLKGKIERVKSIALKAKKESGDDETSTSESDDEEYAMTARVIGNALDAAIRIILLANVHSLHGTKIKKHLLGVLGAIAKLKAITKPTMKLVSWLNRQIRQFDLSVRRFDHRVPFATPDNEGTLPQPREEVMETLKQGEFINVQDLETNLYWEFGKFTSRDGESLNSYYSSIYKMMNELVRNQCEVTNHQVNVQFLLQLKPEWQRSQAATRNKGKATANSPPPTYDSEPEVVVDDEASSKEKEIDKLMALILMSFKKIAKPTNNNLRTSSNTRNMIEKYRYSCSAADWDLVLQLEIIGHVAMKCKKAKWARDSAYHKENMLLCKQEEAGIQLSAEQADWKDDTDDEPEDQELEARYMYMAKIQEVIPDAADNSGPIFDTEPLQKQSKFVNDTYLVEQGDSSYMSNNGGEADQDDLMLQKQRELLASLIELIKIKIDGSKKNNKSLKSSNKALREAITFLNNEFKRYKESDFMKNVELKCAKSYGLLEEHKVTSAKSFISPDMKIVIEQILNPTAKCLTNDVIEFYQTLKEEMVEDLKYFKSLEYEVESLQSQLELQQTQFSNKIDRLSSEYYYVDHMNGIHGVYNNLDEYSSMACDYLEVVTKCERLENEFSKQNENVENKSFNELSKKFAELEKHCISLELCLQHRNESF